MKFIARLIVALAGIVIVVLATLYLLLKTQWGADQASRWISDNTGYHLSFNRLEHSWSSPGHIIFTQFTFGYSGQPAMIIAKKLDIGLSSRQLTDPQYVDSILLQNGTLKLARDAAELPLKAEKLQLQNMNIESTDAEWPLQVTRANGGIAPWLPDTQLPLGNKANIEFSADALTLKGITANNVLLQGSVDNGSLNLSTIGADVARGSVTGNARRNSDGSWNIGNLRLNDIRLQTAASLADFLAPFTSANALKIDRLDVTGARLEGAEWAVSDLDLSLRGITIDKGHWQSDEGQFALNASEFIYGSLHLQDPMINADLTPQGVTLRQFSSRWEGGMLRANGQWQRDGGHAWLNELAVAGLEYTLPANWKALWQEKLPDWLADITLKKLSASRNLIIDITPQWPFQLTALDASATNLVLARHHQWGIWDGSLTAHAANATFNGVDVRRPSIALNANPNQIAISELSAFSEKGLLEASATLSQNAQRDISVSLKGQNVPVNILHAWGWPSLPLQGEGNLTLSATGQLRAEAALKPTVNGSLKVIDANGQQTQQTMTQGVVPGT